MKIITPKYFRVIYFRHQVRTIDKIILKKVIKVSKMVRTPRSTEKKYVHKTEALLNLCVSRGVLMKFWCYLNKIGFGRYRIGKI